MGDAAAAVLPWGLALSALTTALLAVTGWYGGELAYRHMIGVTGHNSHGGHRRESRHRHSDEDEQHQHVQHEVEPAPRGARRVA